MKYQYVSFRKALIRADKKNISSLLFYLESMICTVYIQSKTVQEIPKMGISKVCKLWAIGKYIFFSKEFKTQLSGKINISKILK